jgi:hypothetical protein
MLPRQAEPYLNAAPLPQHGYVVRLWRKATGYDGAVLGPISHKWMNMCFLEK